jgi:hypothetical protein
MNNKSKKKKCKENKKFETSVDIKDLQKDHNFALLP